MKTWFELVGLLVRRDLKIRYRGSFLGYLWSMLNPLLMMLILTVVFSHAMKITVEHFSVYLISGILCWNMFAQSINLGTNSFVANAALLKKVPVPSWVFPTATIGSACVHGAFAFLPYVGIALFSGFQFGWTLLQLPFVFLLFFLFLEGIVLTTSTLNVFFRDVGHVIEPVLQILFYASPVLYLPDILPERYRVFLELNPMYYFLRGFRSALYSSGPLSVIDWATLAGLAGASIIIGSLTYERLRRRFLYHL